MSILFALDFDDKKRVQQIEIEYEREKKDQLLKGLH